jgi:hypothetical protein
MSSVLRPSCKIDKKPLIRVVDRAMPNESEGLVTTPSCCMAACQVSVYPILVRATFSRLALVGSLLSS